MTAWQRQIATLEIADTDYLIAVSLFSFSNGLHSDSGGGSLGWFTRQRKRGDTRTVERDRIAAGEDLQHVPLVDSCLQIQHLVYMGVHENMCIMVTPHTLHRAKKKLIEMFCQGRPFAIEMVGVAAWA